MTSRKDKILADPILAKLVRDGLLTPATHELPPRKPIMTLEELMKGLDADREDRA